MAQITVRTNGQTLTVNASVSHWTSAALAVTASGDDDIPSTTTTTITSDYTMHFANTATTAVVTVKQLDGTTLLSQTFEVNPGVGPRVLNPLPDPYQVAADQPPPGRSQAPSGAIAETFSRVGSLIQNVGTLTSGRLHLTAVYLPAGAVVSSISYTSITTAAVAPTAQWFALYSSARALLAQTADDTSTAWGANTTKTLAIASPYTTTAPGLYYVGIMVAAGTVPSLAANSTHATTTAIAPILNGYSTASLTTTAPATADTLTTTGAIPYAYLS